MARHFQRAPKSEQALSFALRGPAALAASRRKSAGRPAVRRSSTSVVGTRRGSPGTVDDAWRRRGKGAEFWDALPGARGTALPCGDIPDLVLAHNRRRGLW